MIVLQVWFGPRSLFLHQNGKWHQSKDCWVSVNTHSVQTKRKKGNKMRHSWASTGRRIWLLCCSQNVMPHPLVLSGGRYQEISCSHRRKHAHMLPFGLRSGVLVWILMLLMRTVRWWLFHGHSHSVSTLPTHSKTNSNWFSLFYQWDISFTGTKPLALLLFYLLGTVTGINPSRW